MSRHLSALPSEIAPLVLIAGDPVRTEHMAKKFLKNPQLVSKVRNNFCFTGEYKGQRVTFATSGMGVGAIAIYAHELFNEYNVQALVRVGTCGAYASNLQVGEVVLATKAWSRFVFWPEQGSNRHFFSPHPLLNAVIIETAKTLKQPLKTGSAFSTNVFYNQIDHQSAIVKDNELAVVEMEAYALFAMGEKFRRFTATLLTVSDLLYPPKPGQKADTTFAERAFTFDQMYLLGLESLLTFAHSYLPKKT